MGYLYRRTNRESPARVDNGRGKNGKTARTVITRLAKLSNDRLVTLTADAPSLVLLKKRCEILTFLISLESEEFHENCDRTPPYLDTFFLLFPHFPEFFFFLGEK